MAPAGVGWGALRPMVGSAHVPPFPLDFSTSLACIHSLNFSPLKLQNTASSITDMLGFKRTGSELTLFLSFFLFSLTNKKGSAGKREQEVWWVGACRTSNGRLSPSSMRAPSSWSGWAFVVGPALVLGAVGGTACLLACRRYSFSDASKGQGHLQWAGRGAQPLPKSLTLMAASWCLCFLCG